MNFKQFANEAAWTISFSVASAEGNIRKDQGYNSKNQEGYTVFPCSDYEIR